MAVIQADDWSPPAADTVILDYDGRHRRRMAMTGKDGLPLMLDLPETTVLNHGDGLRLEDGRIVAVEAKPELLLHISCTDVTHQVRVAWHLGNRHLPTQMVDGGLRIRHDPVIADMLRGLGATVTEIMKPFSPEGGAYAVGHHHGS